LHRRPRSVLPAILLAALTATAAVGSGVGVAGEGQAPQGAINAFLDPPSTHFFAAVTDPEDDALTFEWNADISCGVFEATSGPNASWSHPEGDGSSGGCPHNDGTAHEGVITVEVEDDDGHRIECTYPPADGSVAASESGTGDPCVPVDPEPERCESTVTAGYFEPSQAVWQDDPLFADRPGKQISQGSPGSLEAELPMIKDKPTLIFGVDGIAGGPEVNGRYRVKLEGTTTGTTPLKVMANFTLANGGEERQIYLDLTVREIPILPPCGDPQPWTFRVPTTRHGLPPVAAFTMTSAGPYTLEAALVGEQGEATGLSAGVSGEVLKAQPLKLSFVPLVITDITKDQRADLKVVTKRIATQSRLLIPDFYPMPPGTIETDVAPPLLLKQQIDAVTSGWFSFLDPSFNIERERKNVLVAQISRLMATGTVAGGADTSRVLMILNRSGFHRLGQEGAVGFAPTTKVVFIRDSEDQETVMHELGHTLPTALWSSDQMRAA
jgi:hypothetical protein